MSNPLIESPPETGLGPKLGGMLRYPFRPSRRWRLFLISESIDFAKCTRHLTLSLLLRHGFPPDSWQTFHQWKTLLDSTNSIREMPVGRLLLSALVES